MCICRDPNCNEIARYGYKNGAKEYCKCHKLDNMPNLTQRLCVEPSCNVRAQFGYPEGTAKYCTTHKQKDMLDIHSKSCKYDGCNKRATHNIKGKSPKYCDIHCDIEMINLNSKLCLYPECTTTRRFGMPGGKSQYCEEHASMGMINLEDKRCQSVNPPCSTLATFGYDKPLYCKEHAEKDMKQVYKPKCQFEGCGELAHYSFSGDKAQYCGQHKQEGQIKLWRHVCEYGDCDTTASFGIKGHKPTACGKHKTDGMIHIGSGLCKFEGCKREPSFGIKGGPPLYCSIHKQEGVIDLKHPRCEVLVNGKPCGKVKCYGYKGGKKLVCATHKEKDMIDLSRKCCEAEGCTTGATNGPLFGKKTHCAKHRANNEYLDNRPKCTTEEDKVKCKNLAYYQGKNEKWPKRCEIHKLEDDVNIVEKPCKSCNLPYYLPDNRDTCDHCEGFAKVHLSHQTRVKNLLDRNNIKYVSYDKPVDSMCSLKRPDFIFDKPLFQVVLEVDERQHLDYTCECELLRMMQIHQDFGGTPVLFLRYNPDKYIDNKGKACTAMQFREKELIRILNQLDNYIEWNKHLSVIYLFYNGYNGVPNKIDLSTTLPLNDL